MSNRQESKQGLTVVGLLGVVFVTLKLVGVIDWSWWWVTVPFWGLLVFWLIVMVILFIVFRVFNN